MTGKATARSIAPKDPAARLGWLHLDTDSDGPVTLDPTSIAALCGGGPATEVHLKSGKMIRLKPIQENQRQELLTRIADAQGV